MKIHTISLLTLLLAFCMACGKSNQQESTNQSAGQESPAEQIAIAPEMLISCNGVGNILFSYNYARLTEVFGSRVGDITEGHDGDFCTVTMPNGATADVYFDFERERGERIAFIMISGPQWKLPNGIHAGMSVADVSAIVGKPVNCFFNEEFIGVYLDPKDMLPCVTAVVKQTAQPDAFIGDVLPEPLKTAGMANGFSSSEEGFRKLSPEIMYIEVANPLK